MDYVDGYLIAVPEDKRSQYIDTARKMAPLFKEYGATRMVECWGEDVPEGKLTSFPMAVKLEPGEAVVFSWITWPSREVRDAAWPRIMEDPRMHPEGDPVFDGKRMIFGGFQMIVDE